MENRRSFLKKAATVGAAGVAMGFAGTGATAQDKSKQKASAVRSPGDKLRVGLIGAGSRSQEHVRNVLYLGGEIVALCDIQQRSIDRAKKLIADNKGNEPKVYTGSDRAFEDMLAKEQFDAVIIASPWEWHVPMSLAAMKAGVKYVGVEVSAANTLEECWDLVNVSEATGSNLMILENVCYRRDVMSVLNMVRSGLFGELLHCRCGYEHDLRDVKFNDGEHYTYQKGGPLYFGEKAFSEAQWRTNHSIHRNGDLYPTHGAGPVAVYLDINRGNRFLSLSAMGTKSRGLHKFIVDNAGRDHEYAKVNFNCGDIVTSMIKCANGETVIVTHDTNSPRPYSLGFRVQGTEGLWYNDGDTIYVQGKTNPPHAWEPSENRIKEYDHKYWRELGEQARNAGHGGMDFIMMSDLFDAIKNNKPTPLDAYDAAAWSAISALSETSIAQGGAVVDFPDFTRGQWIKRKPFFAPDDKYTGTI
jgi:predicted dehydrogenase